MWRTIATHAMAVLLGASIGFTLACWALFPLRSSAEPKYHRGDFRKVPPIAEFAGFTPEKHWSFSCVGSVKDCGEPTPVPEPGTLALFGAGLAILIARR